MSKTTTPRRASRRAAPPCSREVIAAANKWKPFCAAKRFDWRAFYNGFLAGFGWYLTHPSAKEAARLLAWIIDTQHVQLRKRDRIKIERVIRQAFPRYDGSVDPWPAFLDANTNSTKANA